MRAYERLLKYARINTQSCEANYMNTPSSDLEFDLARVLEAEMKEMGFSDVYMDEHAYVYGFIPATAGHENDDAIGFIAHLDIVGDFGSGDPKPQVVENYDGSVITLGTSGLTLDPCKARKREDILGKTLIHTDGTTVLGADDKAGVAEIMTMCERLLAGEREHGKICVCFTPDEEIGHGAELLDLDRFGAKYAYTVDGEKPCEVEYETFNAAKADWTITGYSVHPGSAKDTMINAITVAMDVNGMLPEMEVPEHTEGREGFYHLHTMSGDVAHAKMEYILRDHDKSLLEVKKQKMLEVEKAINAKYGEGVAKVAIADQYQNMAEILKDYPHVVKRAEDAIKKVGLTPVSNPVRGGTDGAQLSFRGLPCPNLGTGGANYHGPFEFAVVEEMDTMVEILLAVAEA